jgi:hypothetical protein
MKLKFLGKIGALLGFAALVFASPTLAQSTATPVLPGYVTTNPCPPAQTICYNGLGSVIPGVAGSSASSAVLLGKPGNLLGAYFTAGGTQGWGMVFNSATAPSNGSTTAGIASGNLEECIYVPADTTQSISFQGLPVEYYSVGITAVFSSTGCGTLTASASAFIHGLGQ